jgi:hypothetical protein
MKPRRDVKETLEIGLTIKQETKKKAEARSELHIPDRNNQKNRKQRKQKKTITQ